MNEPRSRYRTILTFTYLVLEGLPQLSRDDMRIWNRLEIERFEYALEDSEIATWIHVGGCQKKWFLGSGAGCQTDFTYGSSWS